MEKIVTLHANKRWKAVLEYGLTEGKKIVDHYFEELTELHLIIEHGPDWNLLIRCTITLNRRDDGQEQNSASKALRQERAY